MPSGSNARAPGPPAVHRAGFLRGERARSALTFIPMDAGFAAVKRDQANDLSRTLREHREEILARWAVLCRQNSKARQLDDEELLDHLPRLLDRLADAVQAVSDARDTTIPVKESHAHALHRLDAGFDLPEITLEYALLRRVIFAIVAEHAPQLVIGGLDVIGTAIDDSLSESVDYYVHVRHRTLEALDEVTRVITGPGNIESMLHELLSVAMRTIPSVDAVTVLLRQGDVLKVKKALGVMAERDPSFSLRVGEGFAGTIAATGQPMFLSSAHVDALVRSEFIREKGINAMYGVPMIRAGEVLGVAHISSLTAREFAEEDQLLFRTIAERATGVVIQSELMTREKSARMFLEAVIGNITEGVLVASPEGRVMLASNGAARIFGVPKDALCMRLDDLAARFKPRSPQGAPQPPALLAALEGKEIPPHERLLTDAEGRDHHVIVSAAPVAGDGISGAVMIFVDVTEERRLMQDLTRAVAFRERLMGIVSHDLRSPLESISMAAQLVLAREQAPEWAVTSALRVKRGVDRMSRMVSDLLDFTRIAANGALPLARKTIDLRGPVHAAVDEVDVSHPGRIELSLPGKPVEGPWDAARIEQLVANLLNNALQHGAADAPVQVRLTDEGQDAVLSVTNRGPVIPPEAFPTLFDPFREARSGWHRGGLGLGLHIVHEVARAHGGTIEVASDAEHGTTFTARFPKWPSSRPA